MSMIILKETAVKGGLERVLALGLPAERVDDAMIRALSLLNPPVLDWYELVDIPTDDETLRLVWVRSEVVAPYVEVEDEAERGYVVRICTPHPVTVHISRDERGYALARSIANEFEFIAQDLQVTYAQPA